MGIIVVMDFYLTGLVVLLLMRLFPGRDGGSPS